MSAVNEQPWTVDELDAFAHYRFDHGSARAFEVGPAGRYFVDGDGRPAMLRGVNFGARSKLPPYLPVVPAGDGAADMADALADVAPHLDRLKSIGCNVVRLLVMWKALEPVPVTAGVLAPAGARYVARLEQIVDALYARGMFCFLDFHQDLAHELYGGDGFPDWALHVDDEHPRPPATPPPSHAWALRYYATVGGELGRLARRTLHDFWDNRLVNRELGWTDHRVQDHLIHTIGAVAEHFARAAAGAGHPAILGYEPFNEPPQVGIERTDFERRVLPAFYLRAHEEIRRHDDRSFVFVEPRVDWTTYPLEGFELQLANFTLVPQTALAVTRRDAPRGVRYGDRDGPDGRVVFSFHHYDPWTLMKANLPHGGIADSMRNKRDEWPGVFDQLLHAAGARELVPFITELGADQSWARFRTSLTPEVYRHQQSRAYMDLQYRQIERCLLDATYWNYDLYNRDDEHDGWNGEDFSLLGPGRHPRNLDLVARPYPVRSSGPPVHLSFDPGTRIGVLAFGLIVSRAPTVIFVPRDVHYAGDAFHVRATSPHVRWDPVAQLLYFLPSPSAITSLVVISPTRDVDPAVVPTELQLLFLSIHDVRPAAALT